LTPGIYLVHKPVGHSSFALVQAFMEEVRRAGIRRDRLPVCHGGALDPFAEGLVLLLAGQATRLMDLLHDVPKTYEAEIAWGAETDNGDPLGRVIATGDPASLTPQRLETTLRAFLGVRDQVPPAHSNKRVGGERAYALAHRGESVLLPPSRVYLHEASFLDHDLPARSNLRLVSGGGYYVRALARDLGRATGALGHLRRLRRTSIGPWADPGPGEREQVRGAALFPWLPSTEVSEAELAALRAGKDIERRPQHLPAWPLPPGFPDSREPIRAMLDDQLVALLREHGGRWTAAPALKSPL
jgi:tRNA pseudouridine55 synthase